VPTAPLPPIGSHEFGRLPFAIQLELKSLQLFRPDEYARLVGKSGVASPSSALPDLDLRLPRNAPHQEPDLPVSYLTRYWAGYTCSYRERWYSNPDGSSPLDAYGIDTYHIVNTRAFNFSLMVLESSIHYILYWVRLHYHQSRITFSAVLEACKVYMFLALESERVPLRKNRRGFWEPDPFRLYDIALREYDDLDTFEEVNGHLPLILEGEETDYLEWGEYLPLHHPKLRNGLWHYPLIPATLYASSRFSIRDWGFIDPK
jgi:hypothetical protein